MRSPSLSLLVLLFLTLHPFVLPSYIWIGSVTPNSFTVRIDPPSPGSPLFVSVDSNLFSNTSQALQPRSPGFYSASDLVPATRYYFGFANGDVSGSVRTFPEEGAARDVVLVASSCQRWADDSVVWRRIRERFERGKEKGDQGQGEVPFIMLHMGDLHYADIDVDDQARFEEMTRNVVDREDQRRVFRQIPVVYMFDDHDYGKNNAGGLSLSREAALGAYRALVPHYPLKSRVGTLYQAFTVGRVRVIVTDLRSSSRLEKGSTMGSEQLDWFLSELGNAQRFKVVVWMSSKPWIAKELGGADHWGGFPEERRNISNFVRRQNITNLVIISGDAHALAADDGTHSDYSNEGGGGMPVFQAAPIANYGNARGGPYSEGCYGITLMRNYQYGILRIRDQESDANSPCVNYKAYISRGRGDDEVINFERCGLLGGVKGVPGGGQDNRCSLPLVSWWVWLLFVFALLIIGSLVTFLAVFCCRRKKKQPT